MENERHPHVYTLQLFKLAIEKLPPAFDGKRKQFFAQKLDRFESDPETSYEEIRLHITQLGRESWAERQAYQEMYARYGRSSEESFLLQNLDEGIRNKFEKFIGDGGKLNYLEGVRTEEELLAPTPFETYFAPEEKFAVAQALLAARDQARQEIEGLMTDGKRGEYEDLVQEYEQSEQALEQKIQELEKMAGLSDKWRETIIDRVRVIEEGWSVMERGIDEDRLDKELEYWRGTLQAFLQA